MKQTFSELKNFILQKFSFQRKWNKVLLNIDGERKIKPL